MLHLSASRTYPLAVPDAFDAVLPIPLPRLFGRRYGPIPPIRAVEGQDGAWGTVGQTRIVRLSGGGSMREELVAVDRPRVFRYMLSELTGPMTALASQVDGSWQFAAAGTGTRITWEWTVHPASAMSRPALPLFARAWRGYARQALQRIEDVLLPA